MEIAEKEIGTSTYRVQKLNIRPWKRLFLQVGRIVGPALGQLVDSASVEQLKQGNVGGIAEAAKFLFVNLTEKELDSIVEALADVTTVTTADGNTSKLAKQVDLHFSGRQEEFFPWVFFALKVQYESFFAEGGLAAGLRQMTNTPSP